MAHSFLVKVNNELPQVLKKVESEIKESGGRFEGNISSGYFDGKSLIGHVKGKYVCISDCEIKITIVEKPFIVPYGKIESEIRKYFS